MLYLIVFITFIFVLINFVLFDQDFSSPGFLFSLAFLAFEIVCVINAQRFAITFEPETVLVLGVGFLTFTLVSLYFHYRARGKIDIKRDVTPEPIKIHFIVTICVILIQIAAMALFLQYLARLNLAVNGYEGSIPSQINNYNDMIKFRPEDFAYLNMHPGKLYNRCNLIAGIVPYIFIYVTVHNFVHFRKIDIFQIASIGIFAAHIVLTGGRSNLMRLIVLAVIVAYAVKFRSVIRRKSGIKFYMIMLIVMLIGGFLFFSTLSLMGRNAERTPSDLFYIYFGAPIDNLDNYIAQGRIAVENNLFGERTFRNLYSYFADKGLVPYKLELLTEIIPFVKSANGLGQGNVRTMYYFFLTDFGYLGVIPCTALIALISNWAYYRSLKAVTSGKAFSFSLFLYAYMVNDIVMSPFSNRFYENIVTTWFAKIIVIGFIFKLLFIDKIVDLNHMQIRLPRKSEANG
ncbi:MAG: oligosaccharide repeat unit polymerase [Saccharofermentans sp.]|nr:oligosaccharide repeat unit polymerase [Saccharofermentans sp.]